MAARTGHSRPAPRRAPRPAPVPPARRGAWASRPAGHSIRVWRPR